MCDRAWDTVSSSPVMSELPGVTQADWVWAYSMIHTRCFGAELRPGVGAAFCAPVLDMVNHSFSPNSEYVCDPEAGLFQLRWDPAAHGGPAPILGAEVTVSYGSMLPNAFLAVKYGFVDPANPNAQLPGSGRANPSILPSTPEFSVLKLCPWIHCPNSAHISSQFRVRVGITGGCCGAQFSWLNPADSPSTEEHLGALVAGDGRKGEGYRLAKACPLSPCLSLSLSLSVSACVCFFWGGVTYCRSHSLTPCQAPPPP